MAEKNTLTQSCGRVFHSNTLRLGRSANRAGFRASAALNAGVRIDHVLAVAFRDRAHGALGRAGTTGDALIRNLICHGNTSYLFGP